MIENFPVLKLRFHFSPLTPMAWPAFAGSMLRGAWGTTLRRQVCLTHRTECTGCSEQATCDFPRLFETPLPPGSRLQLKTPPQPYVIKPSTWNAENLSAGQQRHFDFVVIGRAIAQLPLVVESWRATLANGLGPKQARTACRLNSVSLPDENDRTLFQPGSGWGIAPRTVVEIPTFPPMESVSLSFESPLRLKRKNDLLGPREIMPEDFLLALERRIRILAEIHAGVRLPPDSVTPGAAAGVKTTDKHLEWSDNQERYSTRQKSSMQFGGLVGTWSMAGSLAPLLPLLYIGQWLHAGKDATFGLGGYRLEGIDTGARL